MGVINIRSFVETQLTISRIKSLNEVVCESDIAIILGGMGAGKDRLLDWWWQLGASHQEIPERLRIAASDIVLINLVPSPSGAVPMACVVFTMIWNALKELERVVDGVGIPKPTGRTRQWHSEGQFLSLFFDNVLPLTQILQPRVVVVGNAHHLDERALHWLLQLRTYARQGHPLLPYHALVLCAQVEPGSEESSKFARLINGNSETKLAWPRKLQLSPMAPAEFVTILATLLRRNLDAIFHESVNTREVTKTFYQWTQGNWWYITELVKVLDRVLGPTKKSGEPRVITEAVIETLRSTWVTRTGRAQEAQAGEQEG